MLGYLIPFLVCWLRSSVVSVLIGLISDTWVIDPHDIKLNFLKVHYSSLLLEPSSVTHVLHYCTGQAQPYNSNSNVFLIIRPIKKCWDISNLNIYVSICMRMHVCVRHLFRRYRYCTNTSLHGIYY